MPSSSQIRKKTPGAAKTSTSVKTPTLIVAPAKSSVLTPQDRRMTYWVAVPDGPGTRLLTADDASRAISDLPSRRPGMMTAYAAASSTRITRAAMRSSSTVAGDIELIASHTPLRLPTAGMMTANSRTMSPPDRAALATFSRTDFWPGAAPSASAGSADTASPPAAGPRPRTLANRDLLPDRLLAPRRFSEHCARVRRDVVRGVGADGLEPPTPCL